VTDDDAEDDDRRSRSEVSRERKADEKRLTALATTLVSLSRKQLDRLGLDEELVKVVDETRRMATHVARARQMRVVRRELRGSHSLAIAEAVDNLLNPRVQAPPSEAQRWAERLLDGGNDDVESFLADHEGADRQHLKGLVRNVRKADAKKLAKARKTLVAIIQAHIQKGGQKGAK